MEALALRPSPSRDILLPGPARLVCLTATIALHLAILWLVHDNSPAPIKPPEPLTISARWAGESNKDDAPAKAAAPAATPAPPPEVKKPAPVPPKVVKPVVKKPAPKPVPKPTPAKPKPVPVTQPAPVAKAQPLVAPVAPATPVAAASSQSPGSASTPAKTRQAGSGGGSSAPIARDARLNNPEPPYPPESRRRGEEGRVVLKVRVSKEGTAESVEVEHSSGYRRLDMAARKTVSRWRFIPAKQNDSAVAAWAGVTIIFKLGA